MELARWGRLGSVHACEGEVFLPRNLLEGGSYRGRAGARRALADAIETWEEAHVAIDDVREVGDRLVVLARTTNTPPGGPRTEYEAAYVSRVKDGKLAELRPFMSDGEAFEALGLQEGVRQGIAAWNSGEMEAMLALLDPDFEYITSGVFPGLAPIYRGHQGFKDFWRDFREVWESLHIEIDELREVDERIVGLLTFTGRGRAGLEVRRRFGNVWTIRHGLAVRIEAYEDWNQALEAVGLKE